MEVNNLELWDIVINISVFPAYCVDNKVEVENEHDRPSKSITNRARQGREDMV